MEYIFETNLDILPQSGKRQVSWCDKREPSAGKEMTTLLEKSCCNDNIFMSITLLNNLNYLNTTGLISNLKQPSTKTSCCNSKTAVDIHPTHGLPGSRSGSSYGPAHKLRSRSQRDTDKVFYISIFRLRNAPMDDKTPGHTMHV